jgi:hypothetical protein
MNAATPTLAEADRRAIDDLMVRYSNMIDERRLSRFAEVFTAGARYDLEGCGLGSYLGEAEIVAFLRIAPHPLLHVTANCELTPETADRVHGFARCLAFGADGLVRIGTYRDVIVRTEAGWRLQQRAIASRTPESIPAPS